MLQELRDALTDGQAELQAWYSDLAPHVRDAYHAPGTIAGVVAVPLLLELGKAIAYPGIEDLCCDLSRGFVGRHPPRHRLGEA